MTEAVDKSSNPFPIEVITVPSDSRKILFEAYSNGEKVGVFDYLPYLVDGVTRYELGQLESYRQKEGVAKALIAKFIEQVGPGALISTLITNEDSMRYFEAHDPNPTRKEEEMINIEDKDELEKIPIVKVLSSCGIGTNSFKVYFLPRAVGRSSVGTMTLLGVTR